MHPSVGYISRCLRSRLTESLHVYLRSGRPTECLPAASLPNKMLLGILSSFILCCCQVHLSHWRCTTVQRLEVVHVQVCWWSKAALPIHLSYAWVRHKRGHRHCHCKWWWRAPMASYWVRIMTSCMNIKRGVYPSSSQFKTWLACYS